MHGSLGFCPVIDSFGNISVGHMEPLMGLMYVISIYEDLYYL